MRRRIAIITPPLGTSTAGLNLSLTVAFIFTKTFLYNKNKSIHLMTNSLSPIAFNFWPSPRRHTASNALLTSKQIKPTNLDHWKFSLPCWISFKFVCCAAVFPVSTLSLISESHSKKFWLSQCSIMMFFSWIRKFWLGNF